MAASDAQLAAIRTGLMKEVAVLQGAERIQEVESLFSKVPESVALEVYQRLNPPHAPWESWHVVAQYFDTSFPFEVRAAGLRVLAARANISKPTIRRTSRSGAALERGSAGRPGRATARRGTDRRAVDRRATSGVRGSTWVRACQRRFPGEPPAWHRDLLDDLIARGKGRDGDDLIRVFIDHIEDGGDPRLFARLCSKRDAFGEWFARGDQIDPAARQHVLEWLGERIGVVPLRVPRPRPTRPPQAEESPPTRPLPPPGSVLSKAVMLENVDTSALKKTLEVLGAHAEIADLIFAASRQPLPAYSPPPGPGGPRFGTNLEAEARRVVEQKIEEEASKAGVSSVVLRKAVRSLPEEFANVAAQAMVNFCRFQRRLFRVWRTKLGRDADVAAFIAKTTGYEQPQRSPSVSVLPSHEPVRGLLVPPSVYPYAKADMFPELRLLEAMRDRAGKDRIAEVRRLLLAHLQALDAAALRVGGILKKDPTAIYDHLGPERKRYIELFDIAEHSIAAKIILAKKGASDVAGALLAAVSIVLSLLPAGFVVRILAVAVAAATAKHELEQYSIAKDLFSVGIIKAEPSLAWVVVAIALEGAQFLPAARAVATVLAKARQGKGGLGPVALLRRAHALAKRAWVKRSFERAVEAHRAVEAAKLARKNRKPLVMAAGGVDLMFPIPREGLLKSIVSGLLDSDRAAEQIWRQLAASKEFRKLPASQQRALFKELSSEARAILAFHRGWQKQAAADVIAAVRRHPTLRRYEELLVATIREHGDEMVDLAVARLSAYRKGGRSKTGAVSGLKGVLQELIAQGTKRQARHGELAARAVRRLNGASGIGLGKPRFFERLVQSGGELTDGVWMAQARDGSWVLLHIDEYKSAGNWRDLYKKQIGKDIDRLRTTFTADGMRLTYGTNFRFSSDLPGSVPLRFSVAFPPQMKGATRARTALKARAESVLRGRGVEATVIPANSPLPPKAAVRPAGGAKVTRKGLDDELATIVFDAVEAAQP